MRRPWLCPCLPCSRFGDHAAGADQTITTFRPKRLYEESLAATKRGILESGLEFAASACGPQCSLLRRGQTRSGSVTNSLRGPTQQQMQRRTPIIEPKRTGTSFAANLSKVVLCVLPLCCSACFRHKITIEDGFRLEENGGAPMLVPSDGHSSDPGNFQTSTLVLPGGSAAAKDRVDQQCVINGEVFSLRSTSQDSRHWTIRSPSISGWDTLAS